MDDGIDETQFLRPIEAEEMAKRVKARGAHRVIYTHAGRFQAIEPILKVVVDHMHAEGWITDDEASACSRFAACKLAADAQHGAKTSRPDATAFSSWIDVPGMADDYRRVLRRVSRADTETADWAYNCPCPPDTARKAYEHRGRIGEALGRIGRALDGRDTHTHYTDK